MKFMKASVAGLAMVAGIAWSPAQALAQAQEIEVTGAITARTLIEPSVSERVGPLTRMTVHVGWTADLSDDRLDGLQDISGVWMIDPRDGSSTGHGKFTEVMTMGGTMEGTFCVDRDGTMRVVAFITGGELDGAILNLVSVAGHPFLGYVAYEGRILLPAFQ